MRKTTKCPFCNQELNWYDDGCGSYIFFCNNCDPELYGSQELWQELIGTRKSLERTLKALLKKRKKGEQKCQKKVN